MSHIKTETSHLSDTRETIDFTSKMCYNYNVTNGKGGALMNTRNAWRLFPILIAIILLTIPVLTPFAELSGTHNHTCSPARCALCMVSSTLRGISDTSAAILFILVPLILSVLRAFARSPGYFTQPGTPIELKTKILS